MYANAQASYSQERECLKGEAGTRIARLFQEEALWIGWRNRFLEGKMPYNVRGMFIYKHNPVLNMPNSC